MGRRYHGRASAATGTNKSILTLISATTIRPMIYDVVIGSVATPADQAARFYLARFTAVGTEGSGFTPVALDPADPAALADYGCGVFTGEPTYTANAILLQISLNQRATFRWVAAPGGELKAPATASNGIGCYSLSSSSTQAHEVSFHHEE
jgi:hypothetical protein